MHRSHKEQIMETVMEVEESGAASVEVIKNSSASPMGSPICVLLSGLQINRKIEVEFREGVSQGRMENALLRLKHYCQVYKIKLLIK